MSAAISSRASGVASTTRAAARAPRASRAPRAAPRRAAAAAAAEAEAAAGAAAGGAATYYFVVANAKFMLEEEEHIVEVLRERKRHLGEKGLEQSFWVVPEPAFLDQMPDVAKRVARPCAAIVSTDKQWLDFIKLRMDRVLKAEFTATGAVADVLKSNNTHPQLSAGNRTAEATPPPGPERLKAGYKQEWSAVYEKYDATWWDAFLPPESA